MEVLLGIFAPFFSFFLSGVVLYRSENCIREFAFPLREKSPRSYFEQNAVLKFVRKLCNMELHKSVHWIHCVFHYVQIASVILPILVSLFLVFFLPIETVGIIYLILSCVPFGFIITIDGLFLFVQLIKCDIIRKTNPEYSKCEFYHHEK